MPDVTENAVDEGPLTSASVLARATGAVEAEVDGERILLSPRDFSYFGLTGSGSHVWDLIDGQRALGQVITELEQQFEAEDGVISREVMEFAEALRAAGLVADVADAE